MRYRETLVVLTLTDTSCRALAVAVQPIRCDLIIAAFFRSFRRASDTFSFRISTPREVRYHASGQLASDRDERLANGLALRE
jgi:hypothetical protein